MNQSSTRVSNKLPQFISNITSLKTSDEYMVSSVALKIAQYMASKNQWVALTWGKYREFLIKNNFEESPNLEDLLTLKKLGYLREFADGETEHNRYFAVTPKFISMFGYNKTVTLDAMQLLEGQSAEANLEAVKLMLANDFSHEVIVSILRTYLIEQNLVVTERFGKCSNLAATRIGDEVVAYRGATESDYLIITGKYFDGKFYHRSLKECSAEELSDMLRNRLLKVIHNL